MRTAEVTLNAAIPWQIVVQGGASEITAELGRLNLAGLEVKGGMSMIRLELPVPSGVVPIRISGGASDGYRSTPGRRPRTRPLQGLGLQLGLRRANVQQSGQRRAAAQPWLRRDGSRLRDRGRQLRQQDYYCGGNRKTLMVFPQPAAKLKTLAHTMHILATWSAFSVGRVGRKASPGIDGSEPIRPIRQEARRCIVLCPS